MSNNVEIKLNSDLTVSKQDVPYQMLGASPHIEMFGNRKISFEGKYKILEYTDELVKIKCKKEYIVFNGDKLNICNIQKSSFLISGKIISVLFE